MLWQLLHIDELLAVLWQEYRVFSWHLLTGAVQKWGEDILYSGAEMVI